MDPHRPLLLATLLAGIAASACVTTLEADRSPPEPSTSLLLERLLEAADRGVRVRLLIDGFRLEGHEELDAALALHPHLEIRAFNPTVHRGGMWELLELVENLERLDHRMHNKLFLVDGVAAVFGGRNVGDEDFGLGEEADFRDFDLLAAGPVVAELAASFDGFWNGPWTVPVGGLAGLPEDARGSRAHADGDVLLVTAYLVPDETLLGILRDHVASGRRVRILTNSYVSTNQPLAHTFYAGTRRALLEAGVERYELRGDAWSHVHHRSPGSGARRLGLHAKSAVFGDWDPHQTPELGDDA